MENKLRNIRHPENLQVKADMVMARISVTDMAKELKRSRNLLNRVLNGHEKGEKLIKLIYLQLEKMKNEKTN